MKPTSELFSRSFRILFFDEMWEYEKTMSELSEKQKTERKSNAYNNLGIAYFEIGQFDKGIENLNLAIELDIQNSIAYSNRAELNKKRNKLQDAENDYEKALELNPKDATFWRCRAYLRKENGKLEKSLADFKQAKKIEPKFQPTKNEIKELEKTLGIERKSWIEKLIGK